MSKPYETKICPICKREFQPKQAAEKYCSDECRLVVKRQRDKKNQTHRGEKRLQIPRTCPVCGKQFMPRSGAQKICGDPVCKKIYHRKYFRKIKTIYRTCDICGKTFVPYVANQRRCSKECMQEAQRGASRRWYKNHPEYKETHTQPKSFYDERQRHIQYAEQTTDKLLQAERIAKQHGLSYGQAVAKGLI